MSKAARTPGPWKVRREPGVWFSVVPATPKRDAAAEKVAMLVDRRANADLIAAAPELLEALRSARRTLVSAVRAGCDLPDFDPAEHVTVKEIDAAIAKAEGKARS